MNAEVPSSSMIVPGMEKPYAFVQRAILSHRLGQSLLFSGIQGLGKKAFATALAKRLLCEDTSEGGMQACGRCRSCHLFHIGHHPDYLLLSPEEEGKQIAVEAIRASGDFLHHMPQVATARVILVCPAENMQHHAANAFLKTLEEPRPHGHILLVSHDPKRLLPTLRSRCQQIPFIAMPESSVATWLEADHALTPAMATTLARLSCGRPHRALEWLEHDMLSLRSDWIKAFISLPHQNSQESLKTAEIWAKDPHWETLIGVLHTVFVDILHLKVVKDDAIINQDYLQILQDLARKANLPALLDLEASWRPLYKASSHNLNLAMQLQNVLLTWRDPQTWTILR